MCAHVMHRHVCPDGDPLVGRRNAQGLMTCTRAQDKELDQIGDVSKDQNQDDKNESEQGMREEQTQEMAGKEYEDEQEEQE